MKYFLSVIRNPDSFPESPLGICNESYKLPKFDILKELACIPDSHVINEIINAITAFASEDDLNKVYFGFICFIV